MSNFQDYSTKLADERHKAVMERLGEIYIEQRKTNGKVSEHGERLATLEERNPAKQGGIWGAIGGMLAGFLAGMVR